MNYLHLTFLLLLSSICHGQIVITGTVKDYHSLERLPFVDINADSVVFNYKTFRFIPPDTTNTNLDGNFHIKIRNCDIVDLTFTHIGYVSLTITDITIDDRNQKLDLGDIYLPYRGQWVEGYRSAKGKKNRKTRKKERRAWRKHGVPNWGGFVNDFLEPFKESENAMIEYPYSGSKKQFQNQNEILVIYFGEFIK